MNPDDKDRPCERKRGRLSNSFWLSLIFLLPVAMILLAVVSFLLLLTGSLGD
jgi:hypothetical protein